MPNKKEKKKVTVTEKEKVTEKRHEGFRKVPFWYFEKFEAGYGLLSAH